MYLNISSQISNNIYKGSCLQLFISRVKHNIRDSPVFSSLNVGGKVLPVLALGVEPLLQFLVHLLFLLKNVSHHLLGAGLLFLAALGAVCLQGVGNVACNN